MVADVIEALLQSRGGIKEIFVKSFESDYLHVTFGLSSHSKQNEVKTGMQDLKRSFGKNFFLCDTRFPDGCHYKFRDPLLSVQFFISTSM